MHRQTSSQFHDVAQSALRLTGRTPVIWRVDLYVTAAGEPYRWNMRRVATLATKCQKRLRRLAKEVLIDVDADFGRTLANSDAKAKLYGAATLERRLHQGNEKSYISELALEGGEFCGAEVPFQ